MSLNNDTQKIANRYAIALFTLAKENKNIDEVLKDVDELHTLITENEEFARNIKSPALTVVQGSAILSEVLKKLKTGDALQGLAKTLCENRRQFALENVLMQFKKLVDDENGVVNAEVVSAFALNSAQTERVEAAVADVVGGDVRISYVVKPAIIGGLIVKIGSKMLDFSIQTKLDKLKLEMKGV